MRQDWKYANGEYWILILFCQKLVWTLGSSENDVQLLLKLGPFAGLRFREFWSHNLKVHLIIHSL